MHARANMILRSFVSRDINLLNFTVVLYAARWRSEMDWNIAILISAC